MINFKPRMASFLFAFGIFFAFSCSSLFINQNNSEQLTKEGNYTEALEIVNQSISENPGEHALKLQKASILSSLARENEDIHQRTSTYSNLKNTVDDLNSSTSIYRDSSNSILVEAWTFEQSQGLRYLQQENSDSYDRSFDQITGHFINAITLIPDSISTYRLLSTTYYRHGDTDQALQTINRAIEQSESPPHSLLEKQAFLLLETGSINQALERYTELTEQDTANETYKRGLVNVLILSENHNRAIELLERLTREYPTRLDYTEALATQKYYKAAAEIDARIESDSAAEISEDEIESFTDQLREAEKLYSDMDILSLNSEERIFRTAVFYKQSSEQINKLHQRTAMDQLPQLANEFLESSLPYWRELTESYPENLSYLKSLHDVYTELGMNDEAARLEQQINY